MIENAIYSCNPPATAPAKVKFREPIEHFIRKIIYKDLKRHNVDETLTLIRKLNWQDDLVRSIMKKVFNKIWKIKFSNIHLITFILSELCRFYPEIGISVVDNTLEEIRVGLEMNIFKQNQKRIACAKYLGEMYNFQVVDSSVVFDTLFLILRFGYPNGIPTPGSPIPIDAPNDFFRLRLVCTLIDSCSSSFRRGIAGRKLDAFLIFMQLYIFTKDTVPPDAEFFIMETLDNVRPGMALIPTYEIAVEMMNNLAQIQPTATDIQSDDEQSLQISSESDAEDTEQKDLNNELEEDNEEQDEEVENIVMQMAGARESDDESQDEEFEREFGRLMQDSIDSRRRERKPANFDAPVPTKRSAHTSHDDSQVTFTLLTKKGNKQQVTLSNKVKSLVLPSDSSLAIQTRSNQEAETQERVKLKELVLSYERGQEEQESAIGNEGIGIFDDRIS